MRQSSSWVQRCMPLIPRKGKWIAINESEFEGSLVYIVSPKTVRATKQNDPISNNKSYQSPQKKLANPRKTHFYYLLNTVLNTQDEKKKYTTPNPRTLSHKDLNFQIFKSYLCNTESRPEVMYVLLMLSVQNFLKLTSLARLTISYFVSSILKQDHLF